MDCGGGESSDDSEGNGPAARGGRALKRPRGLFDDSDDSGDDDDGSMSSGDDGGELARKNSSVRRGPEPRRALLAERGGSRKPGADLIDSDDSDDDDDSDYSERECAEAPRETKVRPPPRGPLRFSLDGGGSADPPEDSFLQLMPPALFAYVAEYCLVGDLRSVAAASRRMHLSVKRLRWRCQKCDERDLGASASIVGWIFDDGATRDGVSGNCALCKERMCDMHMTRMCFGYKGCEGCRNGSIDGTDDGAGCCHDCKRLQQQKHNLFECNRCKSVYCIDGDCGDGGDGKDTCNGEGCAEMLCGNCSNVDYESGWAPHCCGVDGCRNSSGWSGYCSRCAGTHLIDHSANEDVCYGAYSSSFGYACRELHTPGATCSGPCGRRLCSECQVEPECVACDGLALDFGAGWPGRAGCRCTEGGEIGGRFLPLRAQGVLITRPNGSEWTPRLPLRCISCWRDSVT